MWREEDEALLLRLTDEVVIEGLVHKQVGSATGLPRRAASLIAALRKTNDGAEAIEAARAKNYDPLIARLEPGKQADAHPELLHHLALYHARLADARRGAVEPLVHSLTCWLGLGREAAYVRELGEAVTGAALPRQELEKALAEVPFWPLEDLGERAKSGARDLTPESQAALAALRKTNEAATLARAPEQLAKAALRKSAALAAAAVEAALAPIFIAYGELSAKESATAAELVALGQRLAAVWRWSGQDDTVEHAAVEHTTPHAWNHYRQSQWTELGQVIEPIWLLVDSLARRIEADPLGNLAYAAGAAQLLVFRSDVTPGQAETLALLERAVRVCPTHRNARVRLSSDLCDQALRLLPGARAPTRSDYDKALALVRRAEQLYPSLARLPEAQKKLDDAKKLLGIKS